ncbi:Asp23/Gls24 family envelope stress response protein [Streptomyces sp. NBC_01426]|uniref:hypothetical protein n=1 Tax=unclassified Streptomyces TaxID=2593676 RepID=UPI002E2F2CD3|nr:hypothetical protein [Streptomyces sp. NBC_01426]
MALDDPHPTSAAQTNPPPHSDAERLAGSALLPCGRLLGHAWEQARTPARAADPHTNHCPYCREAIEGLTSLDRATHALRGEEQPDGHSLANRVINAVRAEARLGAMLLLNDPGRDLRIAETAAAKILRRAADTVPGTRAASCRLIPEQSGQALHVAAITLSTTLDQPLRERAEAVRQAVLHVAQNVLGLAVTAVNVEVTGVLERSRRTQPEPSER